MPASTIWAGVGKSGWPMPRLTMSRPYAASAPARASTAKAFSSPIRLKEGTIRSMVSTFPQAPTGAGCQPLVRSARRLAANEIAPPTTNRIANVLTAA